VARLGGQQDDVVLLPVARIETEDEVLGGDDPRPELLRRAGEGGGQDGILRQRPLEQQDIAPALRYQILRQRIGQHGAAGQGMQQIGGAIGRAQRIRRLGDVENQRVVRGGGGADQDLGRCIDDEVAHILFRAQPAHLRDQVVTIRRLHHLEGEGHLAGAADGPAVLDRHLGAGQRPLPIPKAQTGIGAMLGIAGVIADLQVADGQGADLRPRRQRPERRRDQHENGDRAHHHSASSHR